jgi:hypothetical protein
LILKNITSIKATLIKSQTEILLFYNGIKFCGFFLTNKDLKFDTLDSIIKDIAAPTIDEVGDYAIKLKGRVDYLIYTNGITDNLELKHKTFKSTSSW